jgi:hypothetical protein
MTDRNVKDKALKVFNDTITNGPYMRIAIMANEFYKLHRHIIEVIQKRVASAFAEEEYEVKSIYVLQPDNVSTVIMVTDGQHEFEVTLHPDRVIIAAKYRHPAIEVRDPENIDAILEPYNLRKSLLKGYRDLFRLSLRILLDGT